MRRIKRICVRHVVALRKGRLLAPSSRSSVSWISTNIVDGWAMQAARHDGRVYVQLLHRAWDNDGITTESMLCIARGQLARNCRPGRWS